MSRPRPELPQGPYLVVGLARSGRAAARALRERGEVVIGLDEAAPERLEGLDELERVGVEVHAGADAAALLARARASAYARTCIKSPGVPRDAGVVAQALELRMPVLGELELGWRLIGNEVVAVTGTNGKTTTVEWIAHVHRVAGRPVTVAGNVGTPISSLASGAGEAGAVDPRATVVCECSSFQLEDTIAFAPEAAVLLNIAEDHLDRHKTFDVYRAAKLKLFERQTAEDIAVVPADAAAWDPKGEAGGRARRVRFGSDGGAAEGVELQARNGGLYWEGEWLMDAGELSLPGRHNLQNGMAVAAACLARGIERDAVVEGLRTFAGVAHRLEEVARNEGVAYVNDSKATNVASTVVALEVFAPKTVHLIAGGQGKGQEFAPLREPIQRACRAVYLIGEDAKQIEAVLTEAQTAVEQCGDLEHAVKAAAEAARPGEVVLLSPACASYDQFADYEARGERFGELARG